ncbi:MAG TPA: rod shape-determining protein MreC [Spirochaetales bacterium]|nr:rod shape-determining protein MreC [Spirochaetales bacterium]HPM72843.1 rod shape-determining protein MreC [Spirochaetales bacterium]
MAARERRAPRRAIGSALFMAVSLITLVVSTRSLAGMPERVGLSVLSFVQRGFDSVGTFVSDTVNSIAELRRLEKNYDDLLARLETLSTVERSYTDLKRENERLREQLGFKNDSAYVAISAKIIARDPENLYSTFVLDKGSTNGIAKNQAVVAYQDGAEGLVGRVIEVGRTSCVVSPIYDSSAYVAVKLERSRYDGIAVGSGSDEAPIIVRYVKKRAKDEIQYGDLVVTSGMQSLYPPGIGVGRVTMMRDLDYLTSLELGMEPLIDFGRIEYVFVVQQNRPDSAGSAESDR